MSKDFGGLEIDHGAEITAEDIQRAQEAAKRWGTPLLNAMLSAAAVDPGDLIERVPSRKGKR